MSANHSSNAVRADSGRRVRFGIFAAAAALIVSAAAFAQAPEPVPAVWKAKELSFFYRSTAVFFPCHELENRVRAILLAVGARDGVQVRATDCEQFMMQETQDSFGRSARDPFESRDPFQSANDRYNGTRRERRQEARVRIQLMTPVVVTPAVLKEIDRDKSRRELISRVTGNPIAAMNDPVVFAAQRQPVTLSRQTIRLEPADCELVEQMSRSVFRELDVKVVRGNYTCDRNQPSHIAPQLTVDALMPVGLIVPQKPGTIPTVPESGAPAPAPASATPAESPPSATATPPVETPAAAPAETPAATPTEPPAATAPR
jgi:DUF1365 family protein